MRAREQPGRSEAAHGGDDASTAQSKMCESAASLTRDLLLWLGAHPRSYAETMEAWRTSCPRFPIWEDALGGGLVCVERAGATPWQQCMVRLTPRGWAVLHDAPAAGS